MASGEYCRETNPASTSNSWHLFNEQTKLLDLLFARFRQGNVVAQPCEPVTDLPEVCLGFNQHGALTLAQWVLATELAGYLVHNQFDAAHLVPGGQDEGTQRPSQGVGVLITTAYPRSIYLESYRLSFGT